MSRSVIFGLLLVMVVGLVACNPSAVTDTTDFGRFDGTIVASWDDDGRNMTLKEPFTYIDAQGRKWLAPAGSVVNGASIPQAFWTVIGGPFEGKYRAASVVHDVGCDKMLGSWEDVHRMFYEACRCGGVEDSQAKIMYYAVYHFGPRWETVTDTVVQEVKTNDGQVVQQEVEVQRVSRIDPLPPTPEEMARVEAYVKEEKPTQEAIRTFSRESLRRRPWHGTKPWMNKQRDGADDAGGGSGASDRDIENGSRYHHGGWQRPPGAGSMDSGGPSRRPGDWRHGNSSPDNRESTHGGSRGYPGGGMYAREISEDEQAWAIEQVRQYLATKTGEAPAANFEIRRARGGYAVGVKLLQEDEEGQLVPYEGGECKARLTRHGQVVEFVAGATLEDEAAEQLEATEQRIPQSLPEGEQPMIRQPELTPQIIQPGVQPTEQPGWRPSDQPGSQPMVQPPANLPVAPPANAPREGFRPSRFNSERFR
jgi:hypothetical protein